MVLIGGEYSDPGNCISYQNGGFITLVHRSLLLAVLSIWIDARNFDRPASLIRVNHYDQKEGVCPQPRSDDRYFRGTLNWYVISKSELSVVCISAIVRKASNSI